MNGLKLPEIEPARPVASAAGAIDRAGAAFDDAAQGLSGVLAEVEKAEIVADAQEADLQVMRGLNELKQLVQSTPYLEPARVSAMFGGNPPVPLTEKRVTPAGEVEVERDVVPMHEIVPYLFEQQSNAILENATRGIRGEGWRTKFREAAKADVERARAEALDWQRAQRLADVEIRSVAQYEQAMNARAWDTAEAILGNADMTMSVRTRETLRADHAGRRVTLEVMDRLSGAQTEEELDALISDLTANAFVVPLDPETQYRMKSAARERKNEMRREAEAAEKARREQVFQGEFDKVQAAVAQAKRTGRPASDFYSVAQIPLGFSDEEFNAIRNVINAESPERKPREVDDPVAWLELSDLSRKGQLGTLSPQQIASYWGRLTETGRRTWMDRWAAERGEKSDGGPSKPPFSEYESDAIHDVITNYYGVKRDKKPMRYANMRAMLERNLLQWKARPESAAEPLLADTIRAIAGRTFSRNLEQGRTWGDDPDTQVEFLETITPEALDVINRGARSLAPNRIVDTNAAMTHFRAMKTMEPEVRALWDRINPAAALTDYQLAEVYFSVTNPHNRKALERVLEKQGKAITETGVVAQAIYGMQIPESVPLAAEVEAELEREAKARDVAAAGKRIAEERKAAERAEAARRAKLPEWERYAEDAIERRIESAKADLGRQYLRKRDAEERASGRPRIIGVTSTLSKARDEALAAETREGLMKLEAELRAQYGDDLAQFKRELAASGRRNADANAFEKWLERKGR